MTTYPLNTVAQFTTRLSDQIELSGEWEIALVEIIYPRTWYNVNGADCHFAVTTIDDQLGTLMICRDALNEGQYETVSDILQSLKAALRRMNEQLIDFSLDPFTKKVVLNTPHNKVITLSPALSQILGFDRTEFNVNERYESSNGSDINHGCASIFVYCDLAQDVVVGDTKAPLLRVLNVEGKFGDVIHKIYTRPIYIPLSKSHFDSIEINIRTETGELVSFVSGKSIVTLHFRRRSNPYFLSSR